MRDYKKDPIRIVALCKTFSGDEFVHPMIDSIYNSVDKIVFVHSNISWTGEKGNTVYSEVCKWTGDSLNKILHIHYDTTDQNEQYQAGLDFIRNTLQYDYIMLVDTDEIWNEEDLNKCKRFIEQNDTIPAFTVNMRTYIKSPFYRLNNIEPCKPTIFVNNTLARLPGVRGNAVNPRLNIPDVYMHHFTYVRKSEEDVIAKIKSSTKEDHLSTVDLNIWVKDKWNRLPDSNVNDLHTSRGYEHYWRGVEVINKEELPKVFLLRDYPIINQFSAIKCGLQNTIDSFVNYKSRYYSSLPEGELVLEDEKILFDISSMAFSILEIGTFLGRSSSILANKIYNASVTTIDIFENIHYIKDELNRKHYQHNFDEYPHYYVDIKNKLQTIGIEVLLRDDSIINKLIKYEALFFDADHSYEGIKEDFNTFFPFLIEGGIFAFHDSVKNDLAPHHEVYKFIEENIKNNFTKLLEGGSITVWKK